MLRISGSSPIILLPWPPVSFAGVKAANETAEKGFCDTEMTKATNDRLKFYIRVNRVSAKIGSLDSQRIALSEEVSVLGDTITKLTKESATATGLRANESAANLKTVKDSKDAVT